MRKFIGYSLTEETPDHSTLWRTRRLYSVETHKAVFRWVLKILCEEGVVEGKTVSIDATTLEPNAALRSLVRRDNGQKYVDYLKELAKAAGIENPTREQLARWDRKRKKKGSNQEWKNPYEPDARVAKMKDGSTHLAQKAEHAVDLSSGALLAVTLQGADQGDDSPPDTGGSGQSGSGVDRTRDGDGARGRAEGSPGRRRRGGGRQRLSQWSRRAVCKCGRLP
jgi:transposase